MAKTSAKQKVCFIISPFGATNSETRRNANGLINVVLKPVLEEFSYNTISSLDIDTPGSITRQVIQHLLEDELVIANLTELNPNVMYELAVRHAKRLPVITLAESSTKLPFDIATERTIFYDNDIAGVKLLEDALRKAVKEIEEDKDVDNPIYRVVKDSIMQNVTTDDTQKYILERINDLASLVNKLNMSNKQNELKNFPFYKSTEEVIVSIKAMKDHAEVDKIIASITREHPYIFSWSKNLNIGNNHYTNLHFKIPDSELTSFISSVQKRPYVISTEPPF